MRFIDVTRPLSSTMLVYPGDLRPTFSQQEQGQYLISDFHMSTHTGTHIDAPSHYLRSGTTIDTIPLAYLIGKCRVLDVHSAGSAITADRLRGRVGCVERLLLKTSFSGSDRFTKNYPCLTVDAAQFIIKTGIHCIGIDSPSIESYHCDGAVHRELLGNDCIVIELLDLSSVKEGEYDMVALPLRLKGLDGSPARVVLWNQEE